MSPAGDAVSPAGDLLASPNFGICDTTHIITRMKINRYKNETFLSNTNRPNSCQSTNDFRADLSTALSSSNFEVIWIPFFSVLSRWINPKSNQIRRENMSDGFDYGSPRVGFPTKSQPTDL